MPGFDPGLRRVSVHAGANVVDLALPAGVPVAVLMPSIVDVVAGRSLDGSGGLVARRYHLSRPGAAALTGTLAQNDIRDGQVLILTASATPPPAPRYEDVAEAVSATLDSTARPWSHSRRRQAARLAGAIAASVLTMIGGLTLIRNAFATNVTGVTVGVAASAGLTALLCAAIAHRTYGDAPAWLALSVIATAFAALAGYLAVPGAPGLPNVVLGATAAVVTSVLAMLVSPCGAVTLTAIACVAAIIAAAALVGVLTEAPPRVIGSVSALTSTGLLGVAARISILLAALSPQLPPAPDLDAKAIRADAWLASLLAAFASVAAAGAVVTVLAGPPRPCRIAFGALTAAVLLLRARTGDARSMLVFVCCGTAVVATTLAALAAHMPNGAWTAAMTATLAAAAIYLGFVASAISPPPVIRRGVEMLECLALVAMVPMTCWVCGLYSAVRGGHLT